MKNVAFYTLGCKVNQYETDAMTELFSNNGYQVVDFSEKADIYIINTCTVTNIADRKSRQMLHRAKKINPDGIVVAVGCYAQADQERIQKDTSIDIVVGNNKKKNVLEIVEAHLKEADYESFIKDFDHTREYETLSISRVSEHTRAYIKIQDGCNQFCSYCIIPYARGRVRSRKPEDIMAEVEALAANGYKEIVLTGIHISSYGIEFEESSKNGEELLDLIRQLSTVKNLARIRLGSLEPRIMTEPFVFALSKIDKVCPHFHLSLQSGCDETLKRMNRKYTTGQYREHCDIIRKYYDHPAITTDVITGFPGETEEEFQTTKAFVQEIGFAGMHIFPYSIRQGTKAAVMENQIDGNVKSERSSQLIAIEKQMSSAYKKALAGKKAEILIEEMIMIDGISYATGYTKEYVKVVADPEKTAVNTIVSGVLGAENHEGFVFCERID